MLKANKKKCICVIQYIRVYFTFVEIKTKLFRNIFFIGLLEILLNFAPK